MKNSNNKNYFETLDALITELEKFKSAREKLDLFDENFSRLVKKFDESSSEFKDLVPELRKELRKKVEDITDNFNSLNIKIDDISLKIKDVKEYITLEINKSNRKIKIWFISFSIGIIISIILSIFNLR